MDIVIKGVGVLTTSDFDEDKYPIPPVPIVPSAEECRHTPVPKGYLEWHEWAERASKKHRQVTCPHCGLLAIWLTKAQAKAYEKARDAELKRRLDEIKVGMIAKRSAKRTRKKKGK